MTNASFWGWEGVCPLRCRSAAWQVWSPGVTQHLQQHLCCIPRSRLGAALLGFLRGPLRGDVRKLPMGEMRSHRAGRSTTVRSTCRAQPCWDLSLEPCPVPKTPPDSARCCSTAGPSLALLIVGAAGRPCWTDGWTDRHAAIRAARRDVQAVAHLAAMAGNSLC